MAITLDEKLAFNAMVTFLATLHEQLGWDNLPPLLGSMALIDGVPLDPAIAEDWKGAVDQTLANGSFQDTVSGLTLDQAYSAVMHFLGARFRKGESGIGQILRELRFADFPSSPPQLMIEWGQSMILASDSTKSISAIVVKDGVSYEIHKTSAKIS